MAAGKSPKDPYASIREKIPALEKHVEGVRNRLNSGTIPKKHAESPDDYKSWLKREINRTETKIADLKLSLPAGK